MRTHNVNSKIKIEMGQSYKCGMNEVVGLRAALVETFKPVQALLKDKIYWNDCEFKDAEYLRRDGFIPYSHNCGGLILDVIVPKCEEYSFGCMEFGECEDCGNAELYPEGDHQCGYRGQECAYEAEGHLDARLRIWLKFKGINEDGELEFYINASGGNDDAPYFRNLPDLFEASFTAKSVAGVKRAASKHIKALLEVLK